MRFLSAVGVLALCCVFTDGIAAQPGGTSVIGVWETEEGYVEIYEAPPDRCGEETKPEFKNLKAKLCAYVDASKTAVCGRVVGVKAAGKEILTRIDKGEADAVHLPVFCTVKTSESTFSGRIFKIESIRYDQGSYKMDDYTAYISKSRRDLAVQGCLLWPACKTYTWTWYGNRYP